jgi:hypothetical protein
MQGVVSPRAPPQRGLCPLLLTPNGEARSCRSGLKLAYGELRHGRAGFWVFSTGTRQNNGENMAGFSRGATPCVVGLLGGFHKPPNSAVGPRPDTNQLTPVQANQAEQTPPKPSFGVCWLMRGVVSPRAPPQRGLSPPTAYPQWRSSYLPLGTQTRLRRASSWPSWLLGF